MEYIPIRFDKSHLTTIGERLYTQSLDLLRELVANAYDADATMVRLTVNDDSIAVEDNGTGMDREGLKQYLTIGSDYKRKNPVSSKFKRVRIGEFGIGKFATLSICDRFEIYSSSLGFAATLIFNRKDFESRNDWNVPVVEHKVNGETGTRVSLFEIKKPISIFDIERHLIQVFPLHDKNFSILLNGNKLTAKYISGERFNIREKTNFGDIRGEAILSSLMLQKEQTGIGIRVKGVLIRRSTFDLENMHNVSVKRLTGEVNADFLPINASRDDFIKDGKEYGEFIKVMSRKLRRVVSSIKQSAISYKDRKAEQLLSEALLNIRDALRKNKNILLMESMPLFAKKQKSLEVNEQITSGVVATALDRHAGIQEKSEREKLREALKKIRPKIRGRIKTLLRDKRRIIKKVKIGGTEFLVSFTHLGEKEEKESFTEGGIIFVNRDHRLYKSVETKPDLVIYHLIRLITQEIIKLTQPRNIELAYDWQGKLIKDAFRQEEK